MADPRHLTRAPIKEALIHIQVTSAGGMDAVQRLGDKLSASFTSHVDLWQNSVGLTINPTGVSSATTEQAKIGIRLDAAPHVLQIKPGGFTFSRLAPYENWEQMRDQAMPYWQAFVDEIQPIDVTGLSVRYINSIPIPAPLGGFETYLTCPPEVPLSLPQSISGFLQQTVIVDAGSNNVARVTQALENGPSDANLMRILLDIDLSHQQGFGVRDSGVWDALDSLRHFKNKIFFEYLTEKTIGYLI